MEKNMQDKLQENENYSKYNENIYNESGSGKSRLGIKKLAIKNEKSYSFIVSSGTQRWQFTFLK